MNVLRHRRPLTFCIDEAQHMTYAGNVETLRMNIDNVKTIADESKVPILMVGTYELLRFSRTTGQLGRRVRHIGFAPYRADKADLKLFLAAANFFRDRLPDAKLSFQPSAHLNMLFAGSVGSVGLLKQWFERALYRAVAAGRSLITLLDFQSERMDIGKLEKIAQENIDGLEEMALLRGNEQHLHQMLGLVPTPPPSSPTPKASPARVGERALGRDPVGIEAV
jgi:hypothetical protein